MAELAEMLALWKAARCDGDDLCLVTVVRTEGSSYRKPGARMLLSQAGGRAGTISGGCLEAEVQKKAWWLTREGPTVKR
jgi:xanthine dehydrogenase accessory factor